MKQAAVLENEHISIHDLADEVLIWTMPKHFDTRPEPVMDCHKGCVVCVDWGAKAESFHCVTRLSQETSETPTIP
jgi:hypothetical protein